MQKREGHKRIIPIIISLVLTLAILAEDMLVLVLTEQVYKIKNGERNTLLERFLDNDNYSYIKDKSFKIIKEVEPYNNLEVEAETVINVSAVALKDSELYAVINGVKIVLTPGEIKDELQIYTGQYVTPSASSEKYSVGKMRVFSQHKNDYEEFKGGEIIIKPYIGDAQFIYNGETGYTVPETDENNTVLYMSPQTDYGLGRARMCIFVKNHAETAPSSTGDDRSNPRFTPQLHGTIDYVTGEFKKGENDYYTLLSGVITKKENVQVFDGYVLPNNSVASFDSVTASGYTNAVVTTGWKVPVNCDFKPQAYYQGYNGRIFNVNEFNSPFFDVTFKYTNSATGSFDFPQSGVVSHAEWINVGENGTTTLRIYLRDAHKFYGYRLFYGTDNRLVISVKEKFDIASPHVVLDPGHGGSDCGAIAVNGTYEANINISIALKAKAMLEGFGYRVTILRTDNRYISLDDRQEAARNIGGDIFVAIHNNSSPHPELSGTEVYYYRAYSQPLAKAIHSRLAVTWQTVYANMPDMRQKVIAADGGVRFYPFHVTRVEECPAVLVECGYLSNEVEAGLLCTEEIQQYMAQSVALGINDYFNNM